MSKITAQKLKIIALVNHSEELRKESLVEFSRSASEAKSLLSKAGMGIWAIEALGMRKDFKKLFANESDLHNRIHSAQRIANRLL